MNWIDPKDRKPPANRLVLLCTPTFCVNHHLGFWSPYAGGSWQIQSVTYPIDSVSAWSEIEAPPKPPEPPTGEKLAKEMENAVEAIHSFPHRDKISRLAGDYYVNGKRYFVWVQLELEQP